MARMVKSSPWTVFSRFFAPVHLLLIIFGCICAYDYSSSTKFDQFCQAPCTQQISSTKVRLWFNELITWRFDTNRVKLWTEQNGNEKLYYWETKTVGNDNSDFIDIVIMPNSNYSFQMVSENKTNTGVIKSYWSLITKMHTLNNSTKHFAIKNADDQCYTTQINVEVNLNGKCVRFYDSGFNINWFVVVSSWIIMVCSMILVIRFLYTRQKKPKYAKDLKLVNSNRSSYHTQMSAEELLKYYHSVEYDKNEEIENYYNNYNLGATYWVAGLPTYCITKQYCN